MKWFSALFCGLTPWNPVHYPLNICPSTDVDPIALRVAMEWWDERGVHFELGPAAGGAGYCTPILVDYTLSERTAGGVPGNMVAMGVTVHDTWSGGVVFLASGLDAQSLAHELGHVAGYRHSPRDNELMSPVGDGWDGWGLGEECGYKWRDLH